jgi:cation diffusion facilitator family transporter
LRYIVEAARAVKPEFLRTAPVRFKSSQAAGADLTLRMPASRLHRGLRATFTGLAVNLFLAISKLVAGIVGHSHALVADAVESLADVFSSLIVWRALVVASEPADEDHPYGHGKAEPLAAAIVSVLLLAAAAWIVVQSLKEIGSPHEAPAPFTLVVLLVVVAVKEALFRYALNTSVSMQSAAVQTDAWHHRSDAITSFAAAVGITIALIGGEGYESADDWAAMAAACVIGWNSWRLLRPALNELMDRAPGRELIEQVRDIARATPGVRGVEKCLARKMGYQYFVDLHVEVDPMMTVLRSHEIAHQVKDIVRQQIPAVRDVLVHIEPGRE